MSGKISQQRALLRTVQEIYRQERGVTWRNGPALTWDSVSWPIGVELGNPYDGFSVDFRSAKLWVYDEADVAFSISRFSTMPFNDFDAPIADRFFAYPEEHDHTECLKFRDLQRATGNVALRVETTD